MSLSLDASAVDDRFDRKQSHFHRELFELEGDGANERGTFPYPGLKLSDLAARPARESTRPDDPVFYSTNEH